MGKPVIVVAGQSNVYTVADELKDALDAQFGAGNYHYVKVFESGAPLTWARGEGDWASASELPQQLFKATEAALRADPGSYLGGVIWLQGEADTYSFAAANQYEDDFLALFNQFRSQLASSFAGRAVNADRAQIVISELANRAPAAEDRANWTKIIAAHKDLADRSLISSVDPDDVATDAGISSAGMYVDGLHYSTHFSQALATSLAQTLTSAMPDFVAVRTGTNGDDWFNALSGPDEMVGGAGDDVYVVDDPGDRVVELNNQGQDRILAWVDTALWKHNQATELLTLMGHGDLNAKGNKLDNTISGNDGDNVLNGAWGNDVLRGGKGNDVFSDDHGQDRMIGGRGNDLYMVDDRGDVIVERAGEGWDTVSSSVSIRLAQHSQNLERLVLTGSANISGIGNRQVNRIDGNDGDNFLKGGRGDDRLFGGNGNDTLSDRAGNDLLSGGNGSDVFLFRGRFGHDTITDFAPGEPGEKIDLTRVGSIRDFDDLTRNHLRNDGDDALIVAGEERSILLHGVSPDDLSASDFLF